MGNSISMHRTESAEGVRPGGTAGFSPRQILVGSGLSQHLHVRLANGTDLDAQLRTCRVPRGA